MKGIAVVALILLAAPALPAADAAGAAGAAVASQFITLGTHGGPVSDRNRSQPANALVLGQAVYLVDAGDGAVQQLARAGLSLAAVRAVLISHIHIDHTGGLFAVLGLRHQMGSTGKITIYGPPGIKAMVDGLLAAIVPEAESGYGVPGEDYVPPQNTVEVVELRDGASVKLDGLAVTTAENTHYSFPKGGDMDRRFASISFRFDMPEVGQMSARAKVHRVLITHLVAGRDPNVDTAPLVAGVRKWFDGPVEIARDLDRY